MKYSFVIIPFYNKEPHIKRAIDSALAQNVQDFEIIIVDDGSTDKGAEVVREFTDPRIRLISKKMREYLRQGIGELKKQKRI